MTPPMRLLAVVSLTALMFGLSGCKRAESEPQAAAMPPPAVSVAAAIEREVAEWDEFSGRLEAVERAEIRPRVSGYIQSVDFKEGKEVSKGDVLFVIDPRPYQAELNRARADLPAPAAARSFHEASSNAPKTSLNGSSSRSRPMTSA